MKSLSLIIVQRLSVQGHPGMMYYDFFSTKSARRNNKIKWKNKTEISFIYFVNKHFSFKEPNTGAKAFLLASAC